MNYFKEKEGFSKKMQNLNLHIKIYINFYCVNYFIKLNICPIIYYWI